MHYSEEIHIQLKRNGYEPACNVNTFDPGNINKNLGRFNNKMQI